MTVRPAQRTAAEQRTVAVDVGGLTAEGQTVRGYAAVFGVLSEDLGGFRERIAPGAFSDVLDDDVRLMVDHAPPPLARTKAGTLRLSQDERGLAFEADLPDTSHARDLRESIARGDVDGASFRFVIGEESWSGDVRTVVKVAHLRDVAIATFPAYPEASIELRSSTATTGGERRQKGAEMDPQVSGAETAETTEIEDRTEPATETETSTENDEQRPTGALSVEQRTTPIRRRGLADEFRAAGFPSEVAEIPWQAYEERAIDWQPSINLLGQVDRTGGPAPVDQRYSWTALQRDPVDSAATSVQVLVHMGSSAATGVVRDIAATTPKAEVESSLDLLTIPLKGVAAVESGIPNVVLEQPAIDPVIQRDLRAAVNEGLDSLVNATFADSDNQAPGTDNPLVSYRKAMTTLLASGYLPDTIILTPQAAEVLDVMVTEDGTADFVFGPGRFAGSVWNLRKVVSKTIPAPVVLDSSAYGRLHASPARLARFEENDGRTNTSLVRLELNAACGVERQDAAVRIAAS